QQQKQRNSATNIININNFLISDNLNTASEFGTPSSIITSSTPTTKNFLSLPDEGKTTSRLNALMNGDMIWKIKFDNNEYVLDKHDMTLSTYIQKYRSHFVMKNYDAMASLPSAEFQKIFHDMTIIIKIKINEDMIQFVAKSSYWSNIDSKIKLNPTHTADNAENNKIEIKVTRPVSSLFLIKDLIKLTIFSQQQIKIFLSKKNLLIEFNSGGICNVRYYITPAEDDFTPYLRL
ncbi:7444_t:CDS:2, partial [Entrophospora sp. SA101]